MNEKRFERTKEKALVHEMLKCCKKLDALAVALEGESRDLILDALAIFVEDYRISETSMTPLCSEIREKVYEIESLCEECQQEIEIKENEQTEI